MSEIGSLIFRFRIMQHGVVGMTDEVCPCVKHVYKYETGAGVIWTHHVRAFGQRFF